MWEHPTNCLKVYGEKCWLGIDIAHPAAKQSNSNIVMPTVKRTSLPIAAVSFALTKVFSGSLANSELPERCHRGLFEGQRGSSPLSHFARGIAQIECHDHTLYCAQGEPT